jgi:hypothetical protein
MLKFESRPRGLHSGAKFARARLAILVLAAVCLHYDVEAREYALGRITAAPKGAVGP